MLLPPPPSAERSPWGPWPTVKGRHCWGGDAEGSGPSCPRSLALHCPARHPLLSWERRGYLPNTVPTQGATGGAARYTTTPRGSTGPTKGPGPRHRGPCGAVQRPRLGTGPQTESAAGRQPCGADTVSGATRMDRRPSPPRASRLPLGAGGGCREGDPKPRAAFQDRGPLAGVPPSWDG